MKKWYHSGEDSTDNPTIKEFDGAPPYGAREQVGPYDSFAKAKAALVLQADFEIQRMRDFKERIKALRKN